MAENVEKEKKAEQPKEASPANAPKSQDKGKKISQMTLQEIDKELKICQEKMGGYHSHHAKNLLSRKKELSESK